jgi:TonB-dependent Receptor Plug Domain
MASTAVSIVISDEIRRAGVTTLADAAALGNGVRVARFNNGTWSVTARGFAAVAANKMLVTIDGRTVYIPLFTGSLLERPRLRARRCRPHRGVGEPRPTVEALAQERSVRSDVSREETLRLCPSQRGGRIPAIAVTRMHPLPIAPLRWSRGTRRTSPSHSIPRSSHGRSKRPREHLSTS